MKLCIHTIHRIGLSYCVCVYIYAYICSYIHICNRHSRENVAIILRVRGMRGLKEQLERLERRKGEKTGVILLQLQTLLKEMNVTNCNDTHV